MVSQIDRLSREFVIKESCDGENMQKKMRYVNINVICGSGQMMKHGGVQK